MRAEDFVIGKTYRFCNEEWPEWVGYECIVTSVDSLVRGATTIPPPCNRGDYPPGTTVSHAYDDLCEVRYNPVEAMFE